MNKTLLKKFTPDILRGAQSVGLEAHSLVASFTITANEFSRLLDGKISLTVLQAISLEAKSGRSIGELAVLGIASSASPEKRLREAEFIRDTLELMAVFGKEPAPPPRTNRTGSRLKSTR